MKLSTIILATSMIVAPAVAFAQSAPAPANQSGTQISPSAPAPTDQGVGSEDTNQQGIPGRPTGAAPSSSRMGTTGSGQPTPRSQVIDSSRRNASPASPAEGVEQEK